MLTTHRFQIKWNNSLRGIFSWVSWTSLRSRVIWGQFDLHLQMLPNISRADFFHFQFLIISDYNVTIKAVKQSPWPVNSHKKTIGLTGTAGGDHFCFRHKPSPYFPKVRHKNAHFSAIVSFLPMTQPSSPSPPSL